MMMEEVQLKLDDEGSGAFYILENGEQIGEMVITVKQKFLTVYHTEVAEKAEGKGLAKKLLSEMVSYARENKLKVIALCPFVHLQFRRHPEEYDDIWLRTQEGTAP
jgi:predicted GNAT family acetyltransferase